jgi:hypothetical protein
MNTVALLTMLNNLEYGFHKDESGPRTRSITFRGSVHPHYLLSSSPSPGPGLVLGSSPYPKAITLRTN